MATVVTITSNGRLMKPQLFLNEEKKLQDWTSSNTTIGSSNKKDLTFSHNYEDKNEIPTVIERYDITDDWTKEQVPIRNDKE
jgi:hypothetical protein